MAPALSPLIAIVGPTGSGKSQLALALARVLGGEIVSCDSVQVYQGLDIGSAKLPSSERCGIPHHLLDVIAPGEELTAGDYARLAGLALADIRDRGSLPILAGGTGFYLRALLEGLSSAPPRDSKLRGRLAGLALRKPAALHRFLSYKDSEAAARIHPRDHQKLIRAIEMTLLAGQPASHIQNLPRNRLEGFAVLKLGLSPDRQQLYSRLNLRTQKMFENGLLEETAGLLRIGLSSEGKPLEALGYKQAAKVILDRAPMGEAIVECQTRTRQYAKRQLTWFRADPDIHWLSGFGTDVSIRDTALAEAQKFLNSLKETR